MILLISNVLPRLEQRRTLLKLMKQLVVLIEGLHYTCTRYYGKKVHYCIDLVEDGRTIQGDVLIKESALNEVVRQLAK